MQANKNLPETIPPKRGWQWLMQAGDIIGRYPAAFCGLAVLWAALGLIVWIPFLGMLALVVLTPGLQAGAMYAVARACDNDRPQAKDLFAQLNGPARGELLRLGGLLLLCGFLGAMLLSLLIAILFPELMSMETVDETVLRQLPFINVFTIVALVLTIFAGVGLAFFFAIPRVAFDARPVSGSLGESFKTCLRHWRALLFFGLAQLVVSMGAWVMMLILLAITSVLGQAGEIIGGILMNVVFVLLQILVCGGQYLAWRDIFADDDERSDSHQASPASRDNEFIA